MKTKKIKEISSFLTKRYGEILLTLLLILIFLISLREGMYLLSNDNYSPELNPTLSVQRYLESPAWRGYRVLGFASESEQADIFRSGLFTGLNTFLPQWSLGQVFSFLTIFVGTISMAYLVTLFVRDFVSSKYSQMVFLISGISYLTTLWTAWVFNFNIMPYVTQFGFLPLLLLSIYLVLKDWNWKSILFFLISCVFFTASSVIATVFFVSIVLITFFTIYFGFLHGAKFKKIVASIVIFLITQLFWLIPFLQYTFSTSQAIIDSYTNRAITANTIDLEADMMNIGNSARFYTRLLGTVDDPDIESFVFPMSEEFQAYDIYKVAGLIPIFLSILGLVFSIAYRKWKLLPLWIVLFGLLFLIKNQNPPLGGIYIWLQENFGLFKQVFRWVSSKLGQPYLITLVLTSSIGFFYFVLFLASFFNKKAKNIFLFIPVILFVSIPLFYSEYMFKGQIFTQRALVDFPSQYYSLGEFLSQDQTSRIFYGPPANNGYFREYEWGFVGSQFLAYVLPNPIMDMSLAIGSDVGERAMLELTNDFNSGNIEELNRDFQKYDVKYILVDRSLIKGRYGYALDWELINTYIPTWEVVWADSFLELYKVKGTTDLKYTESYGKNDVLEHGSFVREYPQEPIFSPLNVDLSSSYIENGYLVKNIKYSGVNTILYSNYKELDILNLPTNLKKSGTEIHSSISIPTVNDLHNTSSKKFTLPSQQEYLFAIGEDVFSNSQLEEGINLFNSWDSVKGIEVFPLDTLQSLELTEIFTNTQPGDCSGGDYRILPNVTAQESSSGFLIEGNSELPCLYTEIKLDKRFKYVGQISLNWESNTDSLIGYCLYSANSKGCLNKEKYLYTSQGYADITLNIPKIINGGDDLSLVLYALNPLGKKASILVRDVKLRYTSEIALVAESEVNVNSKENSLVINRGDLLSIKLPIFNNGVSYIYSAQQKKNEMWQPAMAEDSSLTYKFSVESGLVQKVTRQYINQYQELFNTNPLKKYLWYWAGENISNIPASVCLTYVGDDKCMIDSTFFDDVYSSEARIFSPSIKEGVRMDASFNSISFFNETENRLEDFVVMEIPQQWNNVKFQPIFSTSYYEIEATPLSQSPNTTFYFVSSSNIQNGKNLISIPQAKSDNWVAVGFTNSSLKILPDSTRVYLDGWKQGWDISDMSNLKNIYIFYLPNILSYMGYFLLTLLFIIPIHYFKKSLTHGKK